MHLTWNGIRILVWNSMEIQCNRIEMKWNWIEMGMKCNVMKWNNFFLFFRFDFYFIL